VITDFYRAITIAKKTRLVEERRPASLSEPQIICYPLLSPFLNPRVTATLSGVRADNAAFISEETRSQGARQITKIAMISTTVAAAPPSLP
jgi:hypothetical protein